MKKRLVLLQVLMLLMAVLVPQVAWAETATVYYKEADGSVKSCEATKLTKETVTITGDYYISRDDKDQTWDTTLIVSGSARLIIMDDTRLTITGCIVVEDNNSLTITGGADSENVSGSGQLIVTDRALNESDNPGENARIGSRVGNKCGTITINGGNVYTHSEFVAKFLGAPIRGADIGSGYQGYGGTININGGTVDCKGGGTTNYRNNMEAACIGSGDESTDGGAVTINIKGGTVVAWCSQYYKGYGAGIGTGEAAQSPAIINISGGSVTACCSEWKAAQGAGIGTGNSYKAKANTKVNISGGSVTAYSSLCPSDANGYGAGIGMGENWSSSYGVVDVTISGGTVKAFCNYEERLIYGNAAGIGDGENGGGGTITITGDETKVEAFGVKAIAGTKVTVKTIDQTVNRAHAKFGHTNSLFTDLKIDTELDITAEGKANEWAEVSFGPIETKTVYYKDEKGKVQSCEARQLIAGGTYSGNYYVDGTLNITRLIVDGETTSDSLRLILLDDCQLNAKGCIVVEGSHKITITTGSFTDSITGTGNLDVTDLYNGDGSGDNDNHGDDARIGSREENACGYITINGGTITAYSSQYSTGNLIFGADIGSGYKGSNGCIIINDGKVYCEGGHHNSNKQRGMNAACIGSGDAAEGTIWIRINGGEVYASPTADQPSEGVGIGVGKYARGPADIIINGGTVVAQSSTNGYGYGAGIGTGATYQCKDNTNIVINGGDVYARCSGRNQNQEVAFGAGIGMGDDWNQLFSTYGKVDVTINGGKVRAYSGYYKGYGAGIGGGDDGGCGNIVINGGDVGAFNCEYEFTPDGAGIGDGDYGKSGTLSITGDSTVVEVYGGKAFDLTSATIKAVNTPTNQTHVRLGWSPTVLSEQIIEESVDITDKGKAHQYGLVKFGPIEYKTVYYKNDKGKVESCQAQQLVAGGTLKGNYYVYGRTDITRVIASGATGEQLSDTLRIILIDSCELRAKGCIVVEEGNRLYLTSGNFTEDIDGSGTAYISDDYNGNGSGNHNNYGDDARIGSRATNYCGWIYINGGNIWVYSTYNGVYSVRGADIGSGYEGRNGDIYINGGNVYACGGHFDSGSENSMSAAAIGSGKDALSGNINITINGGKVEASPTANKTSWGAGIGTGENSKEVASIIINGGTVKAHSSTNSTGYGAGIGTGDNYQNESSFNSTIKIAGGDVTAYSSGSSDKKEGYGAGIGMGDAWDDDYRVVDVTISGGNVKATSGKNTPYGSGIGDGDDGGGGTLAITGDSARVEVYGEKAFGVTSAKATAKDQTVNRAHAKFGETSTLLTAAMLDTEIDMTANGTSNEYAEVHFGPIEYKTIYYKDDKGEVKTCEAQQLIAGGSLKGNYYVEGNLDISTVTVNKSLHLILLDSCQLKAKGCIVVEGSDTLTITCGDTIPDIDESGKLYVTDEYNGDGSGNHNNDGDDARIGSRENMGCGYININGGNVYAYSTYNGTYSVYGADLGSGYKGGAGCITINGGKVYGYGGHWDTGNQNGMAAASIGTGKNSNESTIWIRINGGEVYAAPTADKTSYGAGIGTGESAEGTVDLIIKGGTVKAYSSTNGTGYGAGIGTGDKHDCDVNSNIVIEGGTITAYSSGSSDKKEGYGAGIGAGDGADDGLVDVTIKGGTVTAISGTNTPYGSGIGDGDDGGGGTISITGDETVVEVYGETAFGSTSAKATAKDQDTYRAKAIFGESADLLSATLINTEVDMTSKGKANKYGKVTFVSIDDGKITVYYKDDKGDVQTCEALPLISGGEHKGNYYVDGSFDIDRLTVVDTLNLILLDGCKLNAKGCIVVEDNNRLTITSGNTTEDIAGSGTLYVTDETGGNDGDDARIGSREGNGCGYITINGGIVYAYSTYHGAYSIYGSDIGSGYQGDQGCIVINDGKVYCYGGYYDTENENGMCAAGIGSGYKAKSATIWIRINGGRVQAWPTGNKTSYGAGIGTGGDAQGRADIIINGGTVLAESSTNYCGYGAGIGTGNNYKASGNTTIEINGGYISAWSCSRGDSKQAYGAGIGMGDAWDDDYGKVDVTITGGTVNAYSGWYYAYGAGIGGGDDGGCGTIKISGNANVRAFNCSTNYTPTGAGIGDGDYNETGSLFIYGPDCTVDTWGLYGIGHGEEDNNFSTNANPMGSTGKIENGDSYGTAASTDHFTTAWNVAYGERKWRKITFETSTIDVYYTDENGEKVGPVTAFKCEAGLPMVLGGDSTKTVYYYTNNGFSTGVRHEVNCNAVIILGDNARVSTRGISVENDNTFTITTGGTDNTYTGTGTLTATAFDNSMDAAIGSVGVYDDNNPYPSSCGNIIINDGTVNASAYYFGAGIGSGKNATEGGSITINGGTVTASASQSNALYGYGAGIGGGSNRTNPDIIINGGTIKACSSTSNQGWGSGIGAGNSAAAGNITINGGTIVACASESGDKYGAGIGGGYNEATSAILEGGTLTINGDEADVTAKGAKSIVTSTATAIGRNANAYANLVESGGSITAWEQTMDLFNIASNFSVKDYTEAHIYFEQRMVNVYYTQEDGTVSGSTVEAIECQGYLPETLGDGTSTAVYYYLNGTPTQDYRSVVSGNAVLIMADGCEASIAGGITVEDGNTLTITTGGTTNAYDGTGAIDVGTDDYNNAAIGSTQPSGNSSDYAGHTAGTINIYDGNVTAHVAPEESSDETYAAAIGGGAGNGNAGTINITGGNVMAYSAYNGTGNGAGIGGGNGEWFGRMDGGYGGMVTISGNAHVEAYSSVNGTCYGAGIGYGRYGILSLTSYNGKVYINGDSAVVIARGARAIHGVPRHAIPDKKLACVDYGSSSSDYATYSKEGELDLQNYLNSSYGKVYFENFTGVYYTKDDGTVSEETVWTYNDIDTLPETLGNGSTTPVYYYLGTTTTISTRPVVNGNAVIIVGDGVDATLAAGITVPGGSTLTITTGGKTNTYEGSGKLIATQSSYSYDALIGGLEDATCGDIIINGGTVEAIDEGYDLNHAARAAAIGSGYKGQGGSVTINRGTIYATHKGNNASAAAIGTGSQATGDFTITINGGEVKAYASQYSGDGKTMSWGAGIGTGEEATGGMTIAINGGEVLGVCSESGTSLGAGIGKGKNATGTTTITVKGDDAEVTAQGVTAIDADEATSTPDKLPAFADYGNSSVEYETYMQAGELNLLDFDGHSLNAVPYGKVYFSTEVTLAWLEEYGEDDTNYMLRDTLLVVRDLIDGSVIVRDYATSFMANDIEDGQIDYVKDVELQEAEWQQNNWIMLVANDYTGELAEGKRITGVKGTFDKGAMTLSLTDEVLVVDDGNTYTLNNFVAPNFMGTQSSDVNGETYYFVDPKPWEVAEFHWMQWDGEQFIVPTYGTENAKERANNAMNLSGSVTVDWSYLDGGQPSSITSGKAYNFTGLVKLTTTTSASAPRRAAANGASYTVYPLTFDAENPTTLHNLTDLNHEVDHIDYVNTVGQVSAEPWEGINIVVTHYTDGTTSTAKVVK